MKKCTWCDTNTEELHNCDTPNESVKLCIKCKEAFESNTCRKCKKLLDPNLSSKGLCLDCMQIEYNAKTKKREESIMGLGITPAFISDVALTTADYDAWTTMGKEFSPEDMELHEMRCLWINVKLNASGVYDSNIINENYDSIEILLDRNFSRLINNKCKIIICDSSDTRKQLIKSGAIVIDSEKKVVILQA